jgi:hypothetical protein
MTATPNAGRRVDFPSRRKAEVRLTLPLRRQTRSGRNPRYLRLLAPALTQPEPQPDRRMAADTGISRRRRRQLLSVDRGDKIRVELTAAFGSQASLTTRALPLRRTQSSPPGRSQCAKRRRPGGRL